MTIEPGRLPISRSIYNRHRLSGAECQTIAVQIKSLSDYFALFDSLLVDETQYWFRGHSHYEYSLVPSALRHADETDRNAALSLLSEFRRRAELKISKPPGEGENLRWLQLAQHYGLGTRLLDWTENAAVALFFACQSSQRAGLSDGTVYMINPVDLNREVDPKRPRVFDAQMDSKIIAPYLKLKGRMTNRGLRTIALNPVWNSDRITLQMGAFTLHGSRPGGLNGQQSPSLVKLPILMEHKSRLLRELERVGISENTIFPELEHLCSHLKRRANIR